MAEPPVLEAELEAELCQYKNVNEFLEARRTETPEHTARKTDLYKDFLELQRGRNAIYAGNKDEGYTILKDLLKRPNMRAEDKAGAHLPLGRYNGMGGVWHAMKAVAIYRELYADDPNESTKQLLEVSQRLLAAVLNAYAAGRSDLHSLN